MKWKMFHLDTAELKITKTCHYMIDDFISKLIPNWSSLKKKENLDVWSNIRQVKFQNLQTFVICLGSATMTSIVISISETMVLLLAGFVVKVTYSVT